MEQLELKTATWMGAARPTDLDLAHDVAQVGIMPLWKPMPVGSIVTLAERRFMVTGPATREEFVTKAKATFPGFPLWDAMPLNAVYHHVSTD